MPRSPRTALQILIVHCEDAHTISQVAHASGHEVHTAADYQDGIAQLGRQRCHLLIAPLHQDLGPLSAAARRFGVSLWLVGEAQDFARRESEVSDADDFLQTPVVEVVFRQRLVHFLQGREYQKRQTQLENALRENAALDPLTHLPNRHFAMQNLQLQWQRYRRKVVPFCCILCDLDHFKKSNEAHGQRFGDSLLRSVANLLKEKVRGSDLVCRYDGQEFFILCSDTELAGALQLAERLRTKLASLDLQRGAHVSACFAVVQSDARFRSPDQMLRAAEELLDQAKLNGPNQLAVMQPLT